MTTTRREFLAGSSCVAAGTLIGGAVTSPRASAAHQADSATIPIVDTHQHLWDLRRFTLPWLDPKNEVLKPLQRSFLIPDYVEHTAGLNVVRTVYMEVNVEQSQQQAEAEYVIDLCGRDDNSMVGAIIGGYPHDADFADYIRPLAQQDAVKGVRTVLHDPDRPKGLCLRPSFVDNIRRLGDLGLSFDLCMRPDEIFDAATLAAKCPRTRLIVDHCGNLSVQSRDRTLRRKWRDGIRAAADHENVFVKISGIVASAKKDDWSAEDLAPNINECLEAFGEDRCMFGGDWPVCLLGATYRQWVMALKEIVKDRSTEFQRKLFHDNAMKIYHLS